MIDKTDQSSVLALHEQLDRAWEDATAGYAQSEGRPVACGAGCSDCCTPDGPAAGFKDATRLLLSPGEAMILYAALKKLPKQTQTEIVVRASEYALGSGYYRTCPLLNKNGFCSVYAARPILCRTHGLPIAGSDIQYDERDSRGCPKNRRAYDAQFNLEPNKMHVYDLNEPFLPTWAQKWIEIVALVSHPDSTIRRIPLAHVLENIS